MLLGLEDVEQVAACTEAGQDETAPEGRTERARKRRNNRGALPAHLPRIEVVVDIDDKTCPCCKGDLHQIGEDKSERLDMVPAQFRVVVTRRPKYACRACEEACPYDAIHVVKREETEKWRHSTNLPKLAVGED